MRLGMNCFVWTTHVTAEFIPTFRRLGEMGYAGVEIPTIEGDAQHYGMLGQVLADQGLGCTTVTFLGPDQDPLRDDTRPAALDHVKWSVEAADALGAEIVCGPLHSALGVFSGAGPTADELAKSAEFLHAAGEIAADGGKTLAIEYLNRFESYLVNTAADTHALVQQADHPAIRTAYDTHHAHIEETSAAAAIAACADSLVHVQLSESHRGVPGTGQVDWDGTLQALRDADYDGWLMVESFSRVDPEFAKAVCIWRDVGGAADEVPRAAMEFFASRLV